MRWNLAGQFARVHAAGRAAGRVETPKPGKLEHKVVLQWWVESERGWGVRPDGYSLHLGKQERDAYVRAYWAAQPPGPAPDEYSRPEDWHWVLVDWATYEKIRRAPGRSVRDYGSPPNYKAV